MKDEGPTAKIKFVLPLLSLPLLVFILELVGGFGKRRDMGI